jgi:hypothetical protein
VAEKKTVRNRRLERIVVGIAFHQGNPYQTQKKKLKKEMSYFATPLSELKSTLSRDEVCEAVAECIVYAKTDTESTPVYVSNLLPKLSLDSNAFCCLKEEISNHTDLIKMRAVDDLVEILDAIQPTVEILHLDLYDMLQITRGGVVLLNVCTESNHTGTMACIDIYNLRQQIHQQATAKQKDTFCNRRDISLSMLVVIAIALMLWAITIAMNLSA